MRTPKLILAMVLVIALSGAAPAQARDGEVVGTLLGAGIGGLIGSQFGRGDGRTAMTVTGVMVGGIVGNRIGASYDDEDERHTYVVAQQQPYTYAPGYPPPTVYQTNYVPNYVAPQAITPEDAASFDTSNNAYCREYTQQIRVNGRIQESCGTACLQPDGSWRVVE